MSLLANLFFAFRLCACIAQANGLSFKNFIFEFYLYSRMTFLEKYPQLQDKAYLAEVITESVYANMALANRIVPKPRVREIVEAILKEQTFVDGKFVVNQSPT